MNSLKAGFASAKITPPMGINISGYFVERLADGVLDDIYVRALALEAGGKRVVMLSYDLCSVVTPTAKVIRKMVSEALGLPFEAIYLAATHTHTGPGCGQGEEGSLQNQYYNYLLTKSVSAAKEAVVDLKDAKMGWRIGEAAGIAFVRRFRMKDGSVKTNPGTGNPDILAPIGDVDNRVNVLRFERESDNICLVNFGDHPDTVGGCKISADWPGALCATMERAVDNCHCIFFNGAQGDVNHIDVNAKDGDLNDLTVDFDDVVRGYKHAQHMGHVVAGGVLQVYDKVNYVDVDDISYIEKTIEIPSNMPRPDQIELAHKYNDLHKAGKDDQIPYKGMELTTVVAEAGRMVNLEHGPESFPMAMEVLAIGPVAFVAIPGEPFTGIGRALKETEGFKMIMPCCNANGREGYFPMQEAYDEGGYESRSSVFKAGVAERIIEAGKELLKNVR